MIRNKKNVPYIRVLKRTDTYILISGENKKKNQKKNPLRTENSTPSVEFKILIY